MIEKADLWFGVLIAFVLLYIMWVVGLFFLVSKEEDKLAAFKKDCELQEGAHIITKHNSYCLDKKVVLKELR